MGVSNWRLVGIGRECIFLQNQFLPQTHILQFVVTVVINKIATTYLLCASGAPFVACSLGKCVPTAFSLFEDDRGNSWTEIRLSNLTLPHPYPTQRQAAFRNDSINSYTSKYTGRNTQNQFHKEPRDGDAYLVLRFDCCDVTSFINRPVFLHSRHLFHESSLTHWAPRYQNNLSNNLIIQTSNRQIFNYPHLNA